MTIYHLPANCCGPHQIPGSWSSTTRLLDGKDLQSFTAWGWHQQWYLAFHVRQKASPGGPDYGPAIPAVGHRPSAGRRQCTDAEVQKACSGGDAAMMPWTKAYHERKLQPSYRDCTVEIWCSTIFLRILRIGSSIHIHSISTSCHFPLDLDEPYQGPNKGAVSSLHAPLWPEIWKASLAQGREALHATCATGGKIWKEQSENVGHSNGANWI